MSKAVDITEVQRALDRAARNAQRGSSEVRAGQVLVGRPGARDAAPRRGPERVGAPPAMRRDGSPGRAIQEKK